MNEGLPHQISSKLHLYQIDHLISNSHSLDIEFCILDPSDPGAGKTFTTCALAKLKGRKLFIISPKLVVSSWFAIAALFDVTVLGVSNYEAIRVGKYYPTCKEYEKDIRVECPYIEVIKGDDTDFIWDLPDDVLLVFDEAHKGKNHITITSQLFISAKQIFIDFNEKYRNNPIGNLNDGPKMIILSATIVDKVECFRTAAYILGISQYGKHAYRVWLKSLQRTHPGMSQTHAIHQILFPRYGSRMRIRDIKACEATKDIFRNNDVLAEAYPMSPEAEQEIIAAYNEIDEAIQALKTKQFTETCPLTIILRARQRIEMLKVPTISMLAMEHLLSDRSVVLFINFNATRDNLFQILDDFVQKEFGSFVTFVHGGQDASDRAYNIEQFQNDKSRLMICNISAGSCAISLHDLHGNFPRTALISPPWSAIDLKQSLGRIYRANAQSDTIQRIVYCKGRVSPANPDGTGNDTTFNGDMGRKVGVEEIIAEALNKKLKTIEWLNNGDEEEVIHV